LRDLDATSARVLMGLAADVTLLLDESGRILDVDSEDGLGLPRDIRSWIGKEWVETVCEESRSRLSSLLRETSEPQATRWIQVKHPSPRGSDFPVEYRAVGIPRTGRILAVGRELRAIASLQQQLIDAQQALERDYWRFREMETRHRLLLRMVSEGTLILEAVTLRVVEANPAADMLLGDAGRGVVGRTFPEGFEPQGMSAIKELLSRLIVGVEPQSVTARRMADRQDLVVSAMMIRQGQTSLVLVGIKPAGFPGLAHIAPAGQSPFEQAVESAPDGVVLTDEEGRLLDANPAFFALAQLPGTQTVIGEPLDRWLGRSGVDLRVLISNLKRYGSIRLFRTSLRSDIGAVTDVEVSATREQGGDKPQLSFFIRDIGRRLSGEVSSGQSLPLWLAELTERVGHAPLKELVRESTTQIERLCIEAALKLTGENRASAAELLGLSRQSLYVKLARYGLGASPSEEET